MDGAQMTEREYELVKLVMECQPVATEELIRLCGLRLKLNNMEAWSVLAGLMERQILVMFDGRFTTRENSEEFQKLMLEAASARSDAEAEAQRNSRPSRPEPEKEFPLPESAVAKELLNALTEEDIAWLNSEQTLEPKIGEAAGADGDEGPTASPVPMSSKGREAAAQRKARSRKKNAKKAKRARIAATLSRWRVPILIGAGAAVLLVVIFVPLSIFLASQYPKTIKTGGRVLTLNAAPIDKAQQAAEDWLIRYAKGKSSAGRPVFQALNVSSMKTYDVSPEWSRAVPYSLAARAAFDPAIGFEGKVVFVSARSTEGDPAVDYDYQYRLYLSGDERGGYSVVASRSGPEAWMDPYDAQYFEADGKTYSLSLCGEETDQGHCLRMAMLTHGDERQLLYLTEADNTVYAEQHHLRDLNGDGAPDIILDTQYATQLCYLYDRDAGAYALCPDLSGGQLVSSDALPGLVLFTDLTHPGTPACLYSCGGGEMTELARMETGSVSAGGHIHDYYRDGQLVRQHTEDSSAALLRGELDQNQYTTFNQYMTYAYWDELVLETAREQGCLALPTLPGFSAAAYEPLTLWGSYPDYDMTFYGSPSDLLMVERAGHTQVIPCVIGHSGPRAADLTGDGEPELLVPFSGLDPLLLLARWNGSGWDLTGMALRDMEELFEANASFRQSVVSYSGPGGWSSAPWRGEAPAEGMSLSLDLVDYIMSVQESNRQLALTFPVQFEGKDGAVLSTSLTLTATYTVPSDGAPQLAAVRLDG